MRKYLILCLLFLCAGTAWAGSGAVTLANMRLSAVNGTAFTDFSAAGTFTNCAGDSITIIDSAEKKIGGWIKAAGTGETLDDELIVSEFTTPAAQPYDPFTVSGTDITSAINGGITATALQGVISFTMLATYKFTNILILNSGQAPTPNIGTRHGDPVYAIWPWIQYAQCVNGVNNQYRTCYLAGVVNGFDFYNNAAANWSSTNNSLRKVLTPSATGVTIVSSRGGSTYNWASQEAGFNYNDAANYTYSIQWAGKINGVVNPAKPLYGITAVNTVKIGGSQ